TDKHIVFDDYPLADEGVARNLAALADFGVLLHFNKRPDLCLVSDFATVKVDELGQLHVLAKLHVWRYRDVRIPKHRCTRLWFFHGRVRNYSREVVPLSSTERLGIRKSTTMAQGLIGSFEHFDDPQTRLPVVER